MRLTPDETAKLLEICQKLGEYAGTDADGAVTKPLIKDYKNLIRLSVEKIAHHLDIADQTFYRWMNGAGKPRKGNVTRMRQLVLGGDGSDALDEPQEIRVGVSAFWDIALAATFEIGFSAFNIRPSFVRLGPSFITLRAKASRSY